MLNLNFFTLNYIFIESRLKTSSRGAIHKTVARHNASHHERARRAQSAAQSAAQRCARTSHGADPPSVRDHALCDQAAEAQAYAYTAGGI